VRTGYGATLAESGAAALQRAVVVDDLAGAARKIVGAA